MANIAHEHQKAFVNCKELAELEAVPAAITQVVKTYEMSASEGSEALVEEKLGRP